MVVVAIPTESAAISRRAGDEPLMLARALPGVSVLVSPDRYLAGTPGGTRFDATVHVLDDGFQHLQLDRDVDIVHRRTATTSRTRSRSRWPPARAARHARRRRCRCSRPMMMWLSAPSESIFRSSAHVAADPNAPTPMAVGLCASPASPLPARFFEDLRRLGCRLVGRVRFAITIHIHGRDLNRDCRDGAERGGARHPDDRKGLRATTALAAVSHAIECAALTMEPDPLPEFRHWLAGSLRAARDIVG